MEKLPSVSDEIMEALILKFGIRNVYEFRELINSGINLVYSQGYQDGVSDCNKIVNRVRSYGYS